MILNLLYSCMMLLAASCIDFSQGVNSRDEVPARVEESAFAKGADVSWVTQMESLGSVFRDSEGVAKECMQLLKEDCGVNAIRLRVWVHPKDGWNNIDDVLVKALRAKSLGLRLMIDFHFSDIWADPSHQDIPAAWADYDLPAMKAALAEHVIATLTKLKEHDVEPEWVQIGNETRTGMLWPMGEIDNGSNYAELNNAGYDAAKSVFPDSKIIIHVDCGDQLELYTRVFGYMQTYDGKYDMIGMSLYPEADSWQSSVDACVNNINTLYDTYGKSVMVCEIGMHYKEAEACRDCISSLMSKGQATGHLEGIFYWEPESPIGFNGGYDKGCFENGRPTVALDAFKE